jgi:DNA-binding transcriptional LysR family regulator
VTLISRFAVAAELRSGLLGEIDVPGTPLNRPWHVLYPQSRVTRPGVRAFGEFLRSPRARRIIEDLL